MSAHDHGNVPVRTVYAEDRPFGIIGEFATPGALLRAAEKVRLAGFTKFDTHSPFPIHGMDKAMGLGQSPLPWVTLVFGLTGTASAALMQWWMNGFDYPIRVGGKPFVSYQAYVPVMFELTVLFGAIATVLALFAFCKLPQPYHPLFTYDRFARVTDDGFMLAIEASDPKWSEDAARQVLSEAGGTEITLITEAPESLDYA